MKKHNRFHHALAGAVAVGTMCAALPFLASSAAMTGDVNADGSISVQDVVLLQKYLLKKATLSQEAYINADMNHDSKVNIYDLLLSKKQLISGTDPVPSGNTVSSIVYHDSSVSLYDIDGNEITAAETANVTVEGTYVTITAGGEYSVSGSSAQGQLRINTDNTVDAAAAVTLNFEDLTLSNSSAAPVYVENVGDDVTISVKKGTTNTISDGTAHTDSYVNNSGETKEINAAIFSRDDLKIKGKGTLIVNGNYQDGIVCKNDLKLWNGTITVNAKDDGIRGGNSVRIGDPSDLVENGGNGDYSSLNISVRTEAGDGIKSTETDEGKGYVTINGGTVEINSYADGIQAEQTFTMNGGDVTIYTYQGSDYTSSGSGSSSGWGGMGGQEGNSNKTDISAKGIKSVGLYDEAGTTWQSGGDLMINGGSLTIDSSDDSLHCGGDMSLTGGNLVLSSADDAVHSDHKVTIGTSGAGTYDDVVISVLKAYEGIEGQQIYQYSGSAVINSTDDGYNAAGGADGSGNQGGGPGGGWGQGGWGNSSSSGNDYVMQFDGGFALVNAQDGDHDGYDSNGDIIINGGYIISNGNEPFDCGDSGNSIQVNGGVWVSNCGSGGMGGMGGSEMSAAATASGTVSANTRVSVVDGSGNVIVSWIADKNVSQFKVGGSVDSGVTFQTGGELSGSSYFQTLDQTQLAAYGGTLSGGSALTAGSSGSGSNNPWGGRMMMAPDSASMKAGFSAPRGRR